MIVGILMAAGASTRFASSDKLLHRLNGKALVGHAADALRAVECDVRIAAVRSQKVAALLSDFECVDLSEHAPLMADSLKAAVHRAIELGADKALIVLGDMPAVNSSLLSKLVAHCSSDTPSAIEYGKVLSPPACFPKKLLPQLLQLRGDAGARKLLCELPFVSTVHVSPQMAADIDQKHDLDAFENRPKQL